ncbi:MAG: carboxypeptidase regulatory-like domain-containing protein [Thermoanaerobaculia bacterium]
MRREFVLGILLSALPARAGELSGRLTLNDRPAAGITVRTVPFETSVDEARREARHALKPEAIGKAVTKMNGEFQIAFETPPGEPGRIVVLRVEGPGVARDAIPGLWDTSEVEDTGETALRRGVTLSGRVVDGEGHPVADSDVTHPSSADTVRTDANGQFSLEGVPETGNAIVIRRARFAVTQLVDLRSGALPKPIVLRPGLPLSGIVLASDGKTPVPGAIVRIDQGKTSVFAETDAKGQFTVHEVDAGRASIAADGGTEGVREMTSVGIPQPSETVLTVVLAPAPELRGRVLDAAARKPVSGAVVRAVSGHRRLLVRSGTDGTFTLRPTPPGDWYLQASFSRYVPVARRIGRTERADKPVEILLRAGATLSGRVLDDQRHPIAAAKVRAQLARNSEMRPPLAVITAADGTFTLRRIPVVESLGLVAWHTDFEPAYLGDLGLKPGETRSGAVISLRRGAILTGVVSSGETPVAGAQVTVSPGSRNDEAPPRSLAGPSWSWPRATTGPDGRFRVAGLSPGDYALTVLATGFARETRDHLTIGEEGGPASLAITLSAEAAIAGSVKSRRGRGIEDEEVQARSAETAVPRVETARTLPDGSFRIDGLRAGETYNVRLSPAFPAAPWKTVVAPAEGVEILSAGRGRIAGRVFDSGGTPIPEFEVVAESDRTTGSFGWVSPVRQEVSSDDGQFTLENVPAGLRQVRVVAKGYQTARVGGIAVEDGETRGGVEVRLARGMTLRGRVVEAGSGRPIPDVDITVESGSSRTTTDVDGAFTIEGLPAGKVRVTARNPDYAPTSEVAEVGEGGGAVELRLSPGASVSAVVVSAAGEPLPASQATLATQGQRSYGGTKAVTGPDGRVRFSHLSAGRYTMTAASAGRRSRPLDLTLEADQAREDVRVVVGGGPTVNVTVTGLTPEERRNVSVYIAGAGNSYADATALPDGRFEARDLVPGPAHVYAKAGPAFEPGGRYASRTLTVPEDGTVDVELPFEGGFSLTVRVVRDGQPFEGARVYADPLLRETGTPANGTTDAAGTCRLVGLKGGTYRVGAVSMTSSSLAPEQKIEVTADASLELDLPSGRLTGRVVASGSGRPLNDAHVTIRSESASGRVTLTHDATTDDTGRFEMTGLESGTLTLTAQRKDYVLETRSVAADSGSDVVIEMVRGDGLDVTGRDGLLGTPLGSLYVRILSGAGVDLAGMSVALDSQGRGEIPSLAPGSYTIVAGATGLAPVAFDGVTVPGPALAITLTPGGTLDIDVSAERIKGSPLACLVTGPGGRPLPLRVWGKRGDLSISTTLVQLTTFPPVSGTLVCAGSAPVPFTVTEGGTTRLALR